MYIVEEYWVYWHVLVLNGIEELYWGAGCTDTALRRFNLFTFMMRSWIWYCTGVVCYMHPCLCSERHVLSIEFMLQDDTLMGFSLWYLVCFMDYVCYNVLITVFMCSSLSGVVERGLRHIASYCTLDLIPNLFGFSDATLRTLDTGRNHSN